MKNFKCSCGSPVFFEDTICKCCEFTLGFEIKSMEMRCVKEDGQKLVDTKSRKTYKKCKNWSEFNVCNWLVESDSKEELCFGCQFNRTVPNQSVENIPANNLRWLRLEQAKKRLIFSLMQMQLPLENGWNSNSKGLLFDFIESLDDKIVTTGYTDGVITINSIEADHVARVSTKYALNERYRTIIGHLRHETGHYYLDKFKLPKKLREDIISKFGNLFDSSGTNYSESLQLYYANGPRKNWENSYISAYASAHPIEDWAESWSHYLLIMDALETLQQEGYFEDSLDSLDVHQKLEKWESLSFGINQITRSLGMQDAYPFSLCNKVKEKIVVVSEFIQSLSAGTAFLKQNDVDIHENPTLS